MRKKYYLVVLIFSVFSSAVFASEHLIFAVDLIRHGDRTPIQEIPTAKYVWKQGLGELTPQGMHQEYQLGVALRNEYVNKEHLLPAQYTPGTIYVRSTDSDRTLMSAESFLVGLYPPGTGPKLASTKKNALPYAYQPIPIHTVPKEQDDLLYGKAHALITSEAYHPRMCDMAPSRINYWSSLTGLPLKDNHNILLLADNLYIRKLNNVPYPAGMSAGCADEIISAGRKAFVNAFNEKATSFPLGHVFLTTLADYFQQSAQGQTTLRYVLFSGHDITIMSVLSTLGVQLEEVPPYASHLNFSLIKSNENYLVKISYNGRPINAVGCENGVCTLEQFLTRVKKPRDNKIISHQDNYLHRCERSLTMLESIDYRNSIRFPLLKKGLLI